MRLGSINRSAVQRRRSKRNAIALIAGSTVATVGPLPAATASASDVIGNNLYCFNGNTNWIPTMPYSVHENDYHGTNDDVDNANGFSLRSCQWVYGDQTNRQYKCLAEGTDGWVLHVVVDGARATTNVSCTSAFLSINGPAAPGNAPAHIHLHSPDDTGISGMSEHGRCGNSNSGWPWQTMWDCPRWIEMWVTVK